MMKKNGFTLAEVLITLMVIGVVAMMTLPALMTNVQEQQAKTGLKKGFNTIIEAAQMNQAVANFGYADFIREGSDNSADGISREQSLRGLLLNRAQIDTRLSNIGMDNVAIAQETRNYLRNSAAYNTARTDRCVFFRDGSALVYSTRRTEATDSNIALQEDGLPLGYIAYYDINGIKGPNMLSNCQGMQNATNDIDSTSISPNTDSCNIKGKRVIKDQFLIRLRGSSVTPGSAAAKWVLDN